MIIKWMKRLNESLLGLVVGILIYGVLVEIIGVWFVADKIRYTSGLFIGIACAIGMGIHLAIIIEESVRIGEGHEKTLAIKSVLRYIVVCIVLFLMMLLNLGNLYTAIAGMLGLKVSAYAQPMLNKYVFKSTDEDLIQEEKKEN